jgi:hypothetical protein
MPNSIDHLAELLENWDERSAGVIRIELRPVNKHTDELIIGEHEVPRLFMEELVYDVRAAADALRAVTWLRDEFLGVLLDKVLDR